MSWNCCRTCMASENLNRIFNSPDSNAKFTQAISNAVGIKIDPDDNLPQMMCTPCINFINEINKFRKKSHFTQEILLKRFNDSNNSGEIKNESLDFKLEPDIFVSIHTFDDSFDGCNDNGDNEDCKDEFIEENVKENGTIGNKIVVEEKPILFDDSVEQKKVTKATKKNVQRKLRSRKSEPTVTKTRKKKADDTKGDVECEYCHKILTSKLSLRNHYKIHTGFDFVCEHCGKKFITKRLLLMHCRAKHDYEKTDKCAFCDYKASNAEQVKIHERLHTGERPYVCKECGAGFHRKSSYLQHVAIHLPEKTVQCDQCPARFKSVTLMHIHRNRHRVPPYRHRCGVCGNSFARRRNVTRHLLRVHALPPDPANIQRDKVS